MANYGITGQGFTIKRLQDILNEQRQRAVELFQDLVTSGEIVDTSTSTTLGRLIALDAPGDADLWEVAQQCWSAFDPNSATGISLDNLVAYAGISRFSLSPSTALVLVSGDINTVIQVGSTVEAVGTNERFSLTNNVTLSVNAARGITFNVQTVQDSTSYTFNYTPIGTASPYTVTYVSTIGATKSSIIDGIKDIVVSSHPLLRCSVINAGTNPSLVVDMLDDFQLSNFSLTSNLVTTKVRKLADVVCVENGPVEQEANTITNILTPVLGWDSVTNLLAASPGRFTETDEELRLRFRSTKFERATNTIDSLYSALLSVDGVQEVAIYENDTNITDSFGVLPHSFLPVVLGGSSQLVAEAIWLNKPVGTASQGDTVVTITDSQGFFHNIGLERPAPITIYIELVINTTVESNTNFPDGGVDQIKTAIIEYAKNNIGVGMDVVFSRLYTPINSVGGFQVDSLFIGTTPTPVTALNIPIAFNQIASFEAININITVV